MSLHALVEKWRDLEEDAVSNGDFLIAATLRTCADELEAALAGGGEAVAWTTQFDIDCMNRGAAAYFWKSQDMSGIHGPATIPLFTHPAGAAHVTGEMVERALIAGFGRVYDMCRNDSRANMRKDMRAALTAAINPGGSRE